MYINMNATSIESKTFLLEWLIISDRRILIKLASTFSVTGTSYQILPSFVKRWCAHVKPVSRD